MKVRLSLKLAWTLIVLFAVIVPVTTVMLWHSQNVYNNRLNSTLMLERQANESLSHRIEAEIKRLITWFNSESDTVAVLLGEPGNPSSLEEIETLLESIVEAERDVRKVVVTSEQGDIIAAADASMEGRRDAVLPAGVLQSIVSHWRVGEGSDVSEIVIPSSGRHYIGSPEIHDGYVAFKVAIPVGNPVKAVLIATVDVDGLWRQEKNIVGNKATRNYMLDSRGSLITTVDGSDKRPGDLMTHLRITRAALIDEEWSVGAPYKGINNKLVFGTKTSIPLLHWTLVSEVVSTKITQPIIESLSKAALLVLLGLCGFVYLVLYLVNKTLTPIQQACKAIDHVAMGDYQVVLDPSGIRELDALTSDLNNMARFRQSAEEAILLSEQHYRESVDKFRDLYESIPLAYITTDNNGKISECNNSALSLLGCEREELIGRAQFELYADTPDGKEKAMRLNDYLAAGILVMGEELQMKRRDGTVFWVSATVQSEIEGHSRRTMIENITERKKAEAELIAAKHEAESANEAKSEFLSSMSHELRTPMNAILGFGQILEMDLENEEHKSNVREIMNAGNHLLELINEILDLSRIEAGKLELSLENSHLNFILNECLMLIKPLAKKRGINVINNISTDHNYTVRVAYTRFKQVMINLISNAIKYNDENGEVTLSCEVVDSNYIRLYVNDTGVGLTERQRQRLFTPFERANDQDEIEGTGIGLVIAKRLIELMGGEIGVESVPGQGSTFWVKVNLSQESADSRSSVDANVIWVDDDEVESILSRTILYIEDNPVNVVIVKKVVEKRTSHTLISAPDAQSGLIIAKEQRPDLILMDINLPGMNGFEAMQELQKNEVTRDIPVSAISANATPDDIAKGRAAGFQEYITKPFNVNELLNTIKKMLA